MKKKSLYLLLATFLMHVVQGCGESTDKLAAEGRQAYLDGDYRKAVDLLQQATDKGSSEGELWLGRCYANGLGVNESEKRAFELFKTSSEHGNADAAMELANCYIKGFGVMADKTRGRELMEQSARQGSAAGKATLALWAIDGKSTLPTDTILAYIKYAEDQKEPMGIYASGRLLSLGIGAKRDMKEAAAKYEQADEAGNTDATVALAYACYNGAGVNRDPEKAFSLFQKAAEAGNPAGNAGMGMCYYEGFGVARNHARAIDNFKKAEGKNDPAGQWWLGKCYFYGDGVIKDENWGIQLIKKAADQGYAPAQFTMAYNYEHGIGVPFDRDKALAFYTHSAEAGYAPAQTNLGIIYYRGDLKLAKSEKEAFEWFCRGAEGGDSAAMFNLYKCFMEGIGTEPDTSTAIQWLKNAAELGNEQAVAIINSSEL